MSFLQSSFDHQDCAYANTDAGNKDFSDENGESESEGEETLLLLRIHADFVLRTCF